MHETLPYHLMRAQDCRMPFWGEWAWPRRFTSVSPSSMFRALVFLGALHGRVPTDVFLSNSLHGCMRIAKMSYAWRASQRDLRDPGSRRDPGFRRCWVVCFAGHLRKILHRGLVLFVCFCARSRNSLAHKLPAPLVLSCQSSRCL